MKTHCYACERPFDEDKIQESIDKIIQNENTKRANQLKEWQDDGISTMAKVKDIEKRRDALANDRTELEKEIQLIDKAIKSEEKKPHEHITGEKLLAENRENAELLQKIEGKEKEIQGLSINSKDDNESQERKSSFVKKMDELKLILGTVATIEQKKARVVQLNDEGSKYSQEIADLEKQEFLVQEFNKAYVGGIEKKINSIFQTVSFRMFEGQINGGEKEDCTLIKDGVPWNDLNSAGKIQAGIEVINVICKHFNYSAPIFIDNCESIVNIPHTDSQLIKLIVSGEDKKLRIV